MDEFDEIARMEIQGGWDVRDADDESVGVVEDVHDQSFTLRTSVGGTMDITFTDVESADDGRVRLTLSGEELTSDLEE